MGEIWNRYSSQLLILLKLEQLSLKVRRKIIQRLREILCLTSITRITIDSYQWENAVEPKEIRAYFNTTQVTLSPPQPLMISQNYQFKIIPYLKILSWIKVFILKRFIRGKLAGISIIGLLTCNKRIQHPLKRQTPISSKLAK